MFHYLHFLINVKNLSGGRNLCFGLNIYSAWVSNKQIHMYQSTIFQEIMILVTQDFTQFILRWLTVIFFFWYPFPWFPFVYLHVFQISIHCSHYKTLLHYLPSLAKNSLPCCSRIRFSDVIVPKMIYWSSWAEVFLGHMSSKNIRADSFFPSCSFIVPSAA
jgi:hypothetical protein